ncbi:MAG TPA: hypothetical protein VFA18_00360 [Gemmataceae bacterium]|nr:hypothetical protein [Gemmataceae bacterium]
MDAIADDEHVLRHIPAGTLWQAAGPRITSANFQLRHDRAETGVSVTRLKITTPDRLLQLVGGSLEQGSRVAAARVSDVRALGLQVIPKPLDNDPGHAEIQSAHASLDDHACRRRLAQVFHFLP